MAERSYPLPVPLNGETLAEELAAAGVSGTYFICDGDVLVVSADPEPDWGTVELVVSAHTGEPSQGQAQRAAVDPQRRIAELEAAVDLLILDSLLGA